MKEIPALQFTHVPSGLTARVRLRRSVPTPAETRQAKSLLAARVRRHAAGGYPSAVPVRSYSDIPENVATFGYLPVDDACRVAGLQAAIADRIRREHGVRSPCR